MYGYPSNWCCCFFLLLILLCFPQVVKWKKKRFSYLRWESLICTLLYTAQNILLFIHPHVCVVSGGFLAFQAMYPGLVESKANNTYRCTALTSLSQPCLPVSNVGPTRILPFLYLGSSQDALSLETAQVIVMITCSAPFLQEEQRCLPTRHMQQEHNCNII